MGAQCRSSKRATTAAGWPSTNREPATHNTHKKTQKQQPPEPRPPCHRPPLPKGGERETSWSKRTTTMVVESAEKRIRCRPQGEGEKGRRPNPRHPNPKTQTANRGRRWPALLSRQGAIAGERTIFASHSIPKQKRAAIRGKKHRPRAPKRRREGGKPGSQK